MVRKGMGRRTAALAISGVAAVGVLAGCGPTGGNANSAGDGSTSPAPSGSASAPGAGSGSGGGQDAAAVRSAYQKTADEKSAKLTMSTMVGGVGGNGSMTLHGSGVIDLANGGSQVTMNIGDQQIEERTLDGMLYEKLPATTSRQLLPAGKTWLKLDLKKVAGALGGSSGATAGMTDPAAPFTYVKGLSGTDVTKVGTETVNGTRTTHYRASVDVGKLTPGNTAESRQLRQQLGDRLPVDLWLDDQGRIRQEEVRATVKTGAGASASSSASPAPSAAAGKVALDSKLQFTDFGTKADVSAPPAAQTADVTAKLAQGATEGTAGGSAAPSGTSG
ncbi:hypothetical protein [Streptomyces sp. NBC_01497]|uniref:hypothetical protein n=1 Tax=Streptomyces sp. NBC_01497 TaxID=2903885 RepID=UPI002E2F3F34|nr:hypothetical protein [Streptomyces sp. NBC_01497]